MVTTTHTEQPFRVEWTSRSGQGRAGVSARGLTEVKTCGVPTIVGYIWSSGDYGNAAAIGYSVLLFVSGMADNVLKPLMLGRGVEAPMPVILLGALGGMATAGILGMFVGATLLALGYQIFMGWVAARKDRDTGEGEGDSQPAS